MHICLTLIVKTPAPFLIWRRPERGPKVVAALSLGFGGRQNLGGRAVADFIDSAAAIMTFVMTLFIYLILHHGNFGVFERPFNPPLFSGLWPIMLIFLLCVSPFARQQQGKSLNKPISRPRAPLTV